MKIAESWFGPRIEEERQLVELRDEKFKSEAIQEKVHKLFRIFSIAIYYRSGVKQQVFLQTHKSDLTLPRKLIFRDNTEKSYRKKNEDTSLHQVNLEVEPKDRIWLAVLELWSALTKRESTLYFVNK